MQHIYLIETPRLTLREMSLADIGFVGTMLADPEVMRYYPAPLSRTEAEGWIERQLRRYRENGHGLWLVERRTSHEPVGQVGLALQDVDGAQEHEIAYLIHRPFWRQGFATEAAFATRDYAFGHLHLDRVVSLIRAQNRPSQGVARKLGMRAERETVFKGRRHLVFALNAVDPETGRARRS
jgi:RimJ/RimL family protein N-acetyltransferase